MAIHIQRTITLAVLAVVMFASLVGVSLAEDAVEELADEGSGRDAEVTQPDAGVVEAPAEAFPVAPAPADPADADPVAPSDADLVDTLIDRTVDVPEARRSVSPSIFASLPGAADSQPPAADPESQDPGSEEEPAAEEPAGQDGTEEEGEEGAEEGTEEQGAEEETSAVPELLLDWHRLIIIAERGIPDYRPYEPPPAPEPDPNAYDPWLPVRLCESTNTYDINTGNGFYGAYQFTISTWNWVAAQIGRDDLVGLRPDLAAPADQDRMADALAFEVPGGGLGHWPHCGLRYGS